MGEAWSNNAAASPHKRPFLALWLGLSLIFAALTYFMAFFSTKVFFTLTSIRDDAVDSTFGDPHMQHRRIDARDNSPRRRMAHALTFPFRRDLASVMTEAAFQTKSETSEEFMYSQEEFSMIEISAHVSLGIMEDIFLWSQGHQNTHFLGVGSCMIQARRPAAEVAFAMNHGLYLKTWREHAYHKKDCDRRNYLRNLLGSEMERRLWLETGTSAHGPWKSCVRMWHQMLHKRDTSAVIKKFIDRMPLEFQICDEIDEEIAGEVMIAGNWKRRSDDYFDTLVEIARMRGHHRLAEIVEDDRYMTQLLFPKNPGQFYKELTPPNHTFMFETIETSSDANDDDLQRFEHLILSARDNRRILPHNVNKNDIPLRLQKTIDKTRVLCDAVEVKEMNMTDFIFQFEKLEHDLLYCERQDERFQKEVPFRYPLPKYTYPDSAPYDYNTEDDRMRLLRALRSHAGKSYWQD
ncbi:MAG: hypothetical protein SGILL_005981 [Bacillariaceae sp.]